MTDRDNIDRAKSSAARIYNGAGILAASLALLVMLALLAGMAAQGIGGALAVVAGIAYAQHRDRAYRERQRAARAAAHALASAENPAIAHRTRHAAAARARRENGD